MKKKILFIILLLIPFIVYAEPTIDNLYLKWRFDKDAFVYNYYDMENTYIGFNSTELISIEKETGKEKTVNYAGSHVKINEKNILVVDQVEDHINVIIYDEYLNEQSTKTLEDIHLTYFCFSLNDEDFIIVGDYLVNGSYYTYVYFINEKGNIIGNDSFKTIQKTNLESYYANSRKYFILRDYNNNIYDIDENNYTITPRNINSDGTYMYLENTKLSKISSTGEVIDELEIPNGKGSKIVKSEENYIIDTEEYTPINDPDEEPYYLMSIKLYSVDENLNIIKTNTIEESFDGETPSEGLDQYNQFLFNDNQSIFLEVHFEGNNYAFTDTYGIDSDLDYWKTYSSFSYDKTYNDYSLYSKFPFNVYSNKYLSYSQKDEIESILREHYNTSSFGYEYFFDGDKIVLIVKQTEWNDINDHISESYFKTNLVYLDQDYNILFDTEIHDYLKADEYDYSTHDYIYKARKITNKSTIYDNYILVALTSPEKIIIQLYDKEGNLVKDYSDYADNYTTEPVSGVRVTPNGFYVAIGYIRERLAEVKSIAVDSFYIDYDYDFDDDIFNSGILYFTNNYNIKTQVTGNGTVTANLEQAPAGEVVRFTIEPEEGYVLGTIKVTDEFGNVVTFTDYTFTMPSADVLIEVEFIKEEQETNSVINPETSDIAIMLFITIAFISTLLFIKQHQKLNFLK